MLIRVSVFVAEEMLPHRSVNSFEMHEVSMLWLQLDVPMMWLALLKLLNKVCAEQNPRMRDQALQLQSRQATPVTS